MSRLLQTQICDVASWTTKAKDKHKITTSEVKHTRPTANYSLHGTKGMKVSAALQRELIHCASGDSLIGEQTK